MRTRRRRAEGPGRRRTSACGKACASARRRLRRGRGGCRRELRELRLAASFDPNVHSFDPPTSRSRPTSPGARAAAGRTIWCSSIRPGGAPCRACSRASSTGCWRRASRSRITSTASARCSPAVRRAADHHGHAGWVWRWIYGAPGDKAMARATSASAASRSSLARFGPVRVSDPGQRRPGSKRRRPRPRLRAGPCRGRARLRQAASWLRRCACSSIR